MLEDYSKEGCWISRYKIQSWQWGQLIKEEKRILTWKDVSALKVD